MDEHVAGCPDCYEVFAATVQFGLAETEPDTEGVESAEARFGAAGARLRSRRFPRVVGLAAAAAAALVLALGLWLYRTQSLRPSAPLVAELADAMGARRFIEPRLTGGFRHGRLVTLRSGEASQGLDAQPGAVLAAVARIRERAEGDTSPEALGALGVTYLVSGDAAAAVKSLESASAQKPDDAGLLSDLSAAYLVRAKQAEEPADVPKALEAAERAIALPSPPAEAYFNRALALEGLHLVDAARKAWQDYLDRDPSSDWADEARQHLEALSKVRRSSVEEDRARVRAALEGGPAAIDRLAQESPSLLRSYLESDLLPEWADAYLMGQPDAGLRQERARVVGEALSRTTGDALPRDAVRALSGPTTATDSRDPLRSQANGYRTLREAMRLQGLLEPSCAQFRAARHHLESGGSSYAAWVGQYVVGTCLMESDPKAALAELERLGDAAEQQGHLHLLGHVRWLEGLIHAREGGLTQSLERYRRARASFETTRDGEGEASVRALTAESLHLLGDRRGAWLDRGRGLALLSEVASPGRRQMVLSEAVLACLDERMPRTALHFESALVEAAVSWRLAGAASEALTRRAAIHHALGADDLAASDLIECRRWIAITHEPGLAARLGAEADIAEGETLLSRQPRAAAQALDKARTYFLTTAPTRVPSVRLLAARAASSQGLDDVAEQELLAGIEALERGRVAVQDPRLEVSFFDQSTPLFDAMVRLQITKRHDPERALTFVERGHARQLADSLAGSAVTPFDVAALQHRLPEGLALLYYVPLDDRLFGWALTRESSQFMERSLPAAELSSLVAAYRGAVDRRAPEKVLQRAAARLHDELVLPFLPFVSSQRAVVVIPDGVLQSVPFAALWNRQTGRYLLEDYALGVAPSGTVFVRASTRAANSPMKAPRALILGNPQFDRHVFAGLPNLPGAELEAEEISRLYAGSQVLTGSEATRTAFLARVLTSEVVHYAGHGVASADDPSAAQLLLAADPARRESGALHLRDLDNRRFAGTSLVVLAACRTAGGAVSRVEGALSLGRPFLAAGVPDVVASLWDIDDAASRRFFVSFHRALLDTGDPLIALRQTQLAFIHGNDVVLAHPASWAGFICMGGLGPRSLSKGEMS